MSTMIIKIFLYLFAMFSLQLVSVCVPDCLYVGEQNSSQTDALIWTQILLNGCSDPIEIGGLWLKVKVTVTIITNF